MTTSWELIWRAVCAGSAGVIAGVSIGYLIWGG